MRRYFEEEMRYLREEGKVFAERHPEQARYLNIDSINDRDPYVERLFEGFAFLAGRIHERLDDELPEYSEGFFSLLYPHFLKPIPGLSIAEFQPGSGQVSEPLNLPEGTEIRSAPVGDEHTTCRFTTTEDLQIRPLQLEKATLNLESDTTHSLSLVFRVFSGARIDPASMTSVRLYFHADPRVASTMHMFFTRHVESVRLSSGDPDTGQRAVLSGQRWIRPGGLLEEDSLLPYSEYTFAGSRRIQEYLNFRNRFWCIDLLGFDQLGVLDGDELIQAIIKFDRSYPAEEKFTDRNIRLHCCPVVNLFESDAEPIRVLPTEADYRVIADIKYRNSIFVYDVTEVVGIEERTGKRYRYEPYYAFERDEQNNSRFFVQSFRSGPDDRRSTYISVTSDDGVLSSSESEVLSMRLRTTNGNLPREALQENMLNILGPDVPAVVEVSNLFQPSAYLLPPLNRGKDYYWKLLAHLSLNRSSIGSAMALREMLRLYDWSGTDANERRIRGIRELTWTGRDITVEGSVLRGGQVTIEIEEDHFADEGDLCLFGLVLSDFLSMYATINSFVHLRLLAKPSERIYEWKPNRGIKTLL